MKTLQGHDKPVCVPGDNRTMTTTQMKRGKMAGTFGMLRGGFYVVLCFSVLLVARVGAAESIEEGLKKGLIEEEANRNFEAAIVQYESVIRQVDAQRQIAATALFRLGETYRKMGRTNEAVQAYRRVITEFSSEEMLGRLSRQNLGGLGVASIGSRAAVDGETRNPLGKEGEMSEATRAELGKLYAAELALLSRQEDDYKKAVAAGVMSEDEPNLLRLRRDILAMKRKLVEMNDRNFKPGGVAGASDEGGDVETAEIRRLEKVLALSPDLLNAPDGESKTTPLETAASRGQLLVVEYLLGQSGLDLKAMGNGNLSALHWAAINGHKAVVERLIKAGFGVDSTTKGGNQTPLHLAVTRGHRMIVELLLKSGANLKVITGTATSNLTPSGVTPLGVALSLNRKDLIKVLVDAGGYDPKLEGQKATPLSLAVEKENIEAARLLFLKQGRVDVQFEGSWLKAARQGNPELVRVFLQAGADPNVTVGPGKQSPLMEAIGTADPETVRVLLEAKANPNGVNREETEDRNGWSTPLTSSLSYSFWQNHANQGRSKEDAAKVVELLLGAGADPNLQDGSGNWPLELVRRLPADRSMRQELLKSLFKHGGNPRTPMGPSGMSLLHLLVQEAYPEEVELALQYVKDVNPVDDQGRTPLALVSGMLKSSNLNDDWRSTLQVKKTKLLDRGAKLDGLAMDRILVTRGAMASVRSVVSRDATGWNRFTLHEVVAMAYGLCYAPEAAIQTRVVQRPQTRLNRISQPTIHPPTIHQTTIQPPQPSVQPANDPTLTWPDLTNIVVRRLVSTNLAELIPGQERREIRPHFENIELEWGDIVEIPEMDHPLNLGWNNSVLISRLASTLPREIKVNSGGKETAVKLGWGKGFPESYSVGKALDDSGLLFKSSNLSAVKIVRGKAKLEEGMVPYLVLDLNEPTLKYHLWVRDGDVIEVP